MLTCLLWVYRCTVATQIQLMGVQHFSVETDFHMLRNTRLGIDLAYGSSIMFVHKLEWCVLACRLNLTRLHNLWQRLQFQPLRRKLPWIGWLRWLFYQRLHFTFYFQKGKNKWLSCVTVTYEVFFVFRIMLH